MYTVLIVDDAEFSRHELRDMDIWGERSGFCITAEAKNGRDALCVLRQRPVDLVITDIRMPILDGIALTEAALSEKLCHCIILVSQFNSFDYARKGIQLGAFEYLLKPVGSEEALASLRRASLYIRERYTELMKISYADQVLSNQVVDSYPYAEFEELVGRIREGDSDPTDTASRLIEKIWTETGFDILKSAYYLGRVLQDLDGAVRKEFPWISKLTKLTPRTIDFTELEDIDSMRASFLGYIALLNAALTKYQPVDLNSGIIKTACSYILENVETPISLNSLAKKLYISNSYLSLLFKQKTGVNLNSYVTFAKMERSRLLLEEGRLKSYEIAEKLGFSVEYFSKLFKKTYSLSPMEYRKSM